MAPHRLRNRPDLIGGGLCVLLGRRHEPIPGLGGVEGSLTRHGTQPVADIARPPGPNRGAEQELQELLIEAPPAPDESGGEFLEKSCLVLDGRGEELAALEGMLLKQPATEGVDRGDPRLSEAVEGIQDSLTLRRALGRRAERALEFHAEAMAHLARRFLGECDHQ